MRVSTEELRGGARLIHLDGHLDEKSQVSVVSTIRHALDDGRAKLVINLDNVDYMTSSGFAALMALYARARAMGGDIVVLHPPPNAEAMFRLLNLSEVLLTEDLDTALARFDDVEREATRQWTKGDLPPSATRADAPDRDDSSGLLPNV